MDFQGFDTDKIENYIVKNLLIDDQYSRYFVSKLSSKIFSAKYQSILKGYLWYYKKYNKIPPVNILVDKIIPAVCKSNEAESDKCKDVITGLERIEFDNKSAHEWIYDETKKFIKTRTIINAMVQCFDHIEKQDHESVVTIMEDAFKLDFDDSFGHDYFDDMEIRQSKETDNRTISTGIPTLDRLLGGGYRKKTFFVWAGPSGSGKTAFLNDGAVSVALEGYNVLYLSLELSEDYIAARADANFAEVSMDQINVNNKIAIEKAIKKRDSYKKNGKKLGKLIYKEYPPNAICAMDIEALIKSFETKRGLKFDFVVVDYLKLVKPNGRAFADNTYGRIGTVCEELRGIASKYNICLLTAAQTGRQSYNSASIGVEDVSDSLGIVQAADAIVTIQQTKDMKEDGLVLLNIGKSRFTKSESTLMVKFDSNYMRIIDVSEGSEHINHINQVKSTSETKGKQHGAKSIEDIENEATEDIQELDI
jgi:KaiC/GvpD/RAD55 family RecA-like ATPase